jgi:mannosyltransferase OCH1-like enzyme
MFANIYNNYKFNFYGIIDNKYSTSFMNIITKNKNILYNGVIEPELIDQVYLNNNILLHPSKLEAGATVVLEAMSFGLPVICRNIGGLPNAVGINNYNFLCNTENEMFEKLLLINEQNYTDISKNNILKVLTENNEQELMIRLINKIKNIYDYESNLNQIPNIIHYIFGLEQQKEEFPFVYYLSIYSNHLINKPITIYFHYQYLPHGYWWDKAKQYIELNYINVNNLYWGTKKITKFAHKADKIRLEILYKYGGIYMDIDTITYKPYNFLLDYDFVIGIQEDNYGKTNRTLYCNAIILSKKNNIFIKKWIEEYEKHFNPNGWCEASVHLPYIIYNNLTIYEKNRMKVLDRECFYYPSYNNVDKIFEDNEDINDELITLHLWNTYSNKYYKDIQDFSWADTNNSLYSKLIKNIINYTL